MHKSGGVRTSSWRGHLVVFAQPVLLADDLHQSAVDTPTERLRG